MINLELTVCPLTFCAVSMVHVKLCVSSKVNFRSIFRSNIAIHKGYTFGIGHHWADGKMYQTK